MRKLAIGALAAMAVGAFLLAAFERHSSAYLAMAPMGGVVSCGSVWSVTDHATPDIVISNTTCANDRAATNGVNGWRMARGTQSYAVGTNNKKVLTLSMNATSTGSIGGVAGNSVSTANYVGSAAPALGIQTSGAGGANVYQDGNVGFGNACANQFASGSILWVAIDFNTGKTWCSINCTTWLGSGANPDSGAAPAATLTAGTYLPAWSGNTFGVGEVGSAILNTKPTIGGCTNVTGFSQWG